MFSLPATAALLTVSGMMWWDMKGPTLKLDQSRHAVTNQMAAEAKDWIGKDLPADVLKAEPRFKSWLTKGPVFMYFIMDGCPCSADLQPIIQRLGSLYNGRIQFIGVIDKDDIHAKAWKEKYKAEFPIVADPNKSIIHAMKAKNSAASCVVGSSGNVLAMWPGYSQSILLGINAELASSIGAPIPKIDPNPAPLEETAGCLFGGAGK